ncbi:MAG: 16S rRNA (cytidine(1402)-2'-O)-methyltransferase [bacterium]|nr:16S rRNA (cytidine(1402)-2'-O)-methyltransferase [bacterium]
MIGKLFVVGTPIGNLGDFSERAKKVLCEVDFIAAEDTRVTIKLLNKFEIKTPMLSYHEHNKEFKNQEIVNRIMSGENAALVSDAGMPAISDPGEQLVRICLDNGIKVESVPGPSALVTALAISGMPSGRFCFEGFLSVNRQSRSQHLEELKDETRTMIFYEAPHKLVATLKDMIEVFGNREIALVRELTKLHETTERTTLSAAVEKFTEKNPKGEYVLIVAGAQKKKDVTEFTLQQAVEFARKFVCDGMSPAAAAKQAALDTGFRKNEIYKMLVL